MIAEGNWKAKGGEWALGKTQGNKPQVAVEIILLEGPDAGARTTWYGYFGPSEETFERTVESLRLLGWQGDDFSDLTGIGTSEVYAVISHEAHPETGEVRARVKWINAAGGVALTARLDPVEAKTFAASMRGRLLALEQNKPALRAQQKRPTGALDGAPRAATHVTNQPDDDIKF